MGIVDSSKARSLDFVKRLYFGTVPFSFRYEKTYRQTLRTLLKDNDVATDILLERQRLELIDLLNHASTYVPFYRDFFRENGLTMRDFGGIDDLKKLPIVNKEIINKDPTAFLDERLNTNDLVEFKTSGSTGVKFVFKGTDAMYKKEAAFVTRAYLSHGSRLYRDWSIWIRRYVPTKSGDSLFKTDHELRRVYMSAYHLNNSSIHDYVKEINALGYKTISTYPSTAYSFACLIEEECLAVPYVESIHLASEMLLDEWKQKIERVLPGVKLRAHYGQMEKCSFFHQQDGEEYADNVEYGVTEFLMSNGQQKVIGTGFMNRAMPLIRYDIGDTVEPLETPRVGTGLPVTVRRFVGRSDDIIITPEGNRLPGVNFYTMMYKLPFVKMFQLVQVSRDELRAFIVPNVEWTSQMADQAEKKIRERTGAMKIHIEPVSQINRSTETGKIRCIINLAL